MTELPPDTLAMRNYIYSLMDLDGVRACWISDAGRAMTSGASDLHLRTARHTMPFLPPEIKKAADQFSAASSVTLGRVRDEWNPPGRGDATR